MRRLIISLSLLSFFLLHISSAVLSKEKNEHYRAATGDMLEITVYEEADLSGAFEVKENGAITYPLLGQIHVENLTKLEIEKKISSLLEKDYLVKPYVRVSIASDKRRVLILGHVKKPGTYELPEGRSFTLIELITLAGGFTGYAAANGTKIVRTQENDKKVVIDPHLNDIIKGRRKDIELKSGDLIIVPERFF